jgi:hypothetical protein
MQLLERVDLPVGQFTNEPLKRFRGGHVEQAHEDPLHDVRRFAAIGEHHGRVPEQRP